MVYTEIKEKNNKKYYYRVKSVRKYDKINKERIYLGSNLSKSILRLKEKEADYMLGVLNYLLTIEEEKILEKIKTDFKKEPKENKENRYETFISQFTYDSNAIEGNTITLQETAMIIFEGRTPAKSLREINEIQNHKEAIDFILNYKKEMSKEFILELHKIVVKNTFKKELEKEIGQYRTIQVYIRGVSWMPPESKYVANDMKTLLKWHTINKSKLHPLIVAAYFHSGFELIHPFVDGNGRVGRLLMNFILHKNGYPMINIPNTRKLEYYKALEEAQINGNLRELVKFLFELMKEGKVRY